MKIDFDMLKKLAEAGASATVIIAMLEEQYVRGETKRKRDKENKILARAGMGKKPKATRGDNVRHEQTRECDTERQRATLDDTPRARLFREGTEALELLGLKGERPRRLIAGWLKLTHDDEQLVLATILRARDMAVSEAPGWILATLKGKTNGARPHRPTVHDVAGDLIARAEALERDAGVGEPEPFTIEGTRNG